MNALQDRLDAQARQMAFELGYGDDSRAAHPSNRRQQALASIRPCTQKQVAYIKSLLEERDVAPCVMQQVEIARGQVMRGALSSQGASALIDELLSSPKKVAGQGTGWTRTPLPERDLEDGIYIVRPEGANEGEDGDIYKVYVAVHGSGQLCVKRLTIEWDGTELEKKGTFRYLGLAAKHLPLEARRLSLEEAQQFGKIYGFCVRCGRTLTDEESIAAGIGPVCAGKF